MNSYLKLKISFFLVFISFSFSLKANNLLISNISLHNKNTVEDYLYIHFDISWENSWRINTGPQNWDAAWIFVKFRVNGGVWQHATLSNENGDHTSPSGSAINVSNDGKGVFLYRSAIGSGNVSWQSVQLKWEYGEDAVADDDNNIEVRIFGIEMVYVNEGPFYVGDGSSIGHLYDATDGSKSQPAYISENPVIIKADTDGIPEERDDDKLTEIGILVDGDNGIDTVSSSTLNNPDFPTGYKAFYCMKYEISQEQYVEFLNTLTRIQQDKCTHRERSDSISEIEQNPYLMSNVDTRGVETRNGIYAVNTENDEVSPLTFYCNVDTLGINKDLLNQETDGQNIGCNLIGWLQGTSYADWAALRPMTELEFEKACRGPETVVAGEYAWHTINLYGSVTLEYSFLNFGETDEYPQNPGTGVYANAAYEYTTGHKWTSTPSNITHPTRIDSPVRTGIFATSTSDRVNAGASYYGIMELSGNLNERCVSLGHAWGRQFKGTHGDGNLVFSPVEEAGNATNSDWPGIILNEESKGSNYIQNGAGYRGGDWNDGVSRLMVSERFWAAVDIYGPNIGSGFRCVRTAE